jgi:hypothetical protein
VKYSSCKDFDRYLSGLVNEGWTFSWGGRHGRLRHSALRLQLIVPSTPSDARALPNFKAMLRRSVRRALVAQAEHARSLALGRRADPDARREQWTEPSSKSWTQR